MSNFGYVVEADKITFVYKVTDDESDFGTIQFLATNSKLRYHTYAVGTELGLKKEFGIDNILNIYGIIGVAPRYLTEPLRLVLQHSLRTNDQETFTSLLQIVIDNLDRGVDVGFITDGGLLVVSKTGARVVSKCCLGLKGSVVERVFSTDLSAEVTDFVDRLKELKLVSPKCSATVITPSPLEV